MAELPITHVLPELLSALTAKPNAVLIAPPGAGKTTSVAPALLDQPWCAGQILLLSPRRLAARAAAERMAELAGEPVGQTVGYATRMDSKGSAGTRIMVLTEGIFLRRIQADPELSGVSAVLFDEVHERSLDSDFGLALALDAQAGLRPDLRVVAMSATLDGGRFAALMDAPIIESAGRSYPLAVHHIGRRADERIEDVMASAIRRAFAEQEGDILAFLPGVSEIDRTAERLVGIAAEVLPLHGSLDPAAQRAALHKNEKRKVILATSIAETSLTIDGVRIVIDSGLARRARYDRVAGSTRLVTERASQAAATQRAGRAARQGPGVVYRLWEAAATAGMPPYDPPEILEADLSPLLLDCALWGVIEPPSLRWLDPPPAAALAEARTRLNDLGALDTGGRTTDHGRAMANLPLPPRLAHMLIASAERGLAVVAAQAAVLLSERGLGGQDVDLDRRRERWRGERGQRAEKARRLAQRWVNLLPAGLQAGSGKGEPNGPGMATSPDQMLSAEGRGLGIAIALAYPDRVARRRDASGEHWLSVGGRGYRLDPAIPLAKAEWLAVADIQGAAAGARITAAVAISAADVEALFGGRIIVGTQAIFEPATASVQTISARRLGAITLSKGPDVRADHSAIMAALVEGVRSHGLHQLPWSAAAAQLRSRANFAGLSALHDNSLLAGVDQWLPPLLGGLRRLGDIDGAALYRTLLDLLGWDGQQSVSRLAPPHFTSPAGTQHDIDYNAPAGPTVSVRVQALFGLIVHPVIGPHHTPLVLELTSPAGRPLQTTRDLPGFWRGSWADVVKDMRGRYPRHNWPDDPAGAAASLKTKRALAKKP